MGHSAASAPLLARNVHRVWTTPPDLANRLCTLVLSHHGDLTSDAERSGHTPLQVLDPACGRGDILLAMMGALHASPLVDDAPLGSVEPNLYGVEVQEDLAVVARRVLSCASERHDGVQIVQGDSLVDRPGHTWPERYPDVMGRGGFDLIVGNPPYLRHEEIADPLGAMPPEEYKRLLRLSAGRRLPPVLGERGERLDGRTDLAGFFLLLGVSLLRPRGVLGFVVSTALLDTQYGQQLLDLMEASGYRIHVETDSRRRFQAAVNTAILLATRGPHTTGGLTTSNLAKTKLQQQTVSRRGRVEVKPPFSIPTRPLRTLGRLRYPTKTGINAFFLPNEETIQRFDIEDRFLQPYLKSPREVPALRVVPGQLPSRVLICGAEDRDDVMNPGLARYITWGEQQMTRDGTLWPLAPSVRGREAWYALPQPPPADVLCLRFFFHRLFFVLADGAVREDQTFYGLILHPAYRRESELIAALLNCSFTLLAIEQGGRSSLGEGVRQYALCDTLEIPVPDVDLLGRMSRDRIRDAFNALAIRRPLPIRDEMQQSDRQLLDDAVADGFGLPNEEVERYRQLVVRQVEERLVRAAGFRRTSRKRGKLAG